MHTKGHLNMWMTYCIHLLYSGTTFFNLKSTLRCLVVTVVVEVANEVYLLFDRLFVLS